MNSIDSAARLAAADSELKRMLDAVVAQVREVAQREIMPRFLRVVHDQRKDDGSFCSEADLAAEHFLHGRLLEIRDCPIIGEEMTRSDATRSLAWWQQRRQWLVVHRPDRRHDQLSSTASPSSPYRWPGYAPGGRAWR
jgi:3'-phosphoadenosine 5'-phosphosulfate (PAPS) 3'-phosphatase